MLTAEQHLRGPAIVQTWDGNHTDIYADDFAQLTEKLDRKDALHVGHSTGGGVVARYNSCLGSKRLAKAVPIGAAPPRMLKTAADPGGLPNGVFDSIRGCVRPTDDGLAFFRPSRQASASNTLRNTPGR
jgi:pimeloyl-ACP methyl ester carboxylesterase